MGGPPPPVRGEGGGGPPPPPVRGELVGGPPPPPNGRTPPCFMERVNAPLKQFYLVFEVPMDKINLIFFFFHKSL